MTRVFIAIVLGIASFITTFNVVKYFDQGRGQAVLGERSEVSASDVSSEPTRRPTTTPEPTPTLFDLPTPTPGTESRHVNAPKFTDEEIYKFINRFASQYGANPDALRHIATCESQFRADAVNGDYAGLFQFAPTTWKNIRKEMGEENDPDIRFNAEEASQTAAYALAKGKGGIWPNCQP